MKLPLILIVSIIGAGSGGCAAIGTVEDKVVDGVSRYCGTVLQSERAVVRGRINAKLEAKGHSVAVTCNGDS